MEGEGSVWQVLNEPFLCLHIFSFLEAEELARVSAVSAQWYSLTKSDLLWKELCRRRGFFDKWNEVKHLESPRSFLVNEILFEKSWRTGDVVVHSIPGFKVSHFRTSGTYVFGFSGMAQQVYVWELFTGQTRVPDSEDEATALTFNPSLVPKHLVPSLTLPVSMQLGNKTLLAVTSRTNLHHSMSNDWPTTAVAQTSLRRETSEMEMEEEEGEVDRERTPFPMEAARIVLNHAGYRQMPEELLHLPSSDSVKGGSRPILHHIDLRFNQISSIPNQYFNALTNIRVLILSNNRFDIFPIQVCQLKESLEFLDVGENRITVVPPVIGELYKLTFLRLSKNPLGSNPLPEELGTLTRLVNLRLFHTELTNFPSMVLRLRNLTELDFGDCKLTELPTELGDMTQLKILRLDNNPLSYLPSSIGDRIKLKELKVPENVLVKNEEGKIVDVGVKLSPPSDEGLITENDNDYLAMIRVYDLDTGYMVSKFSSYKGALHASMPINQQLLKRTDIGTAFEAKLSSESTKIARSRGMSLSKSAMVELPSGMLLTNGMGGDIYFWDHIKSSPIWKLHDPALPMEDNKDLLIIPSAKALVSTTSKQFSVFDMEVGQVTFSQLRLAQRADGSFYAPNTVEEGENTMRIKNAANVDGFLYLDHGDGHSDRGRLSSVWDVQKGKLKNIVFGCSAKKNFIVLSRPSCKGHIAVWYGSLVEIWDILDEAEGGRMLNRYNACRRGAVTCVVQSGAHLFIGSNEGVRVLDLEGGVLLRSLLEMESVACMAIGVLCHSLVVSGIDGVMRIYRPRLVEGQEKEKEGEEGEEGEGSRMEVSSSAQKTKDVKIICASCNPFFHEASSSSGHQDSVSAFLSYLSSFAPTPLERAGDSMDICLQCMKNCHQGHVLEYSSSSIGGYFLRNLASAQNPSPPCKCCQLNHATAERRLRHRDRLMVLDGEHCSYEIARRHSVPLLQKFYRCSTCANFEKDAHSICSHCATACHKGHSLTEMDADYVTCDCGTKNHLCQSAEDIEQQMKQQAYFERNIMANAAAQLLVGMEPDWQNWKEYHPSKENNSSSSSSNADNPPVDVSSLTKRIDQQFMGWFSDGRFDDVALVMLSEEVLQQSEGSAILRAATMEEEEEMGGFGSDSMYCILDMRNDATNPSSPSTERGLLIQKNSPHFYLF